LRLFVALDISSAIRDSIDKLSQEWRQIDNSWRWVRARNLHITLKFLGEIPDERVDGIVEALRGVAFGQAFVMTFRGLGFFPGERRPHVLWVGIEAEDSLPGLAKRIDEAVGKESAHGEPYEFTPHLTLARNKDGRISTAFRELIVKNSGRQFGTMEAAAFHLMRSELRSAGAEYTTLATFPVSPKTA